VHTREGELCVYANEMTQTCIYTNMGTCLGTNSYSGSSHLLYYLCGPNSIPGNYISTLIVSYGRTSLPGNYISTLIISCGPTSLMWSSISLYSFLGCSSTVQLSYFDFLKSYSFLRKVVQEGIPPATTKTSTLPLI
jgi:hypothetical protein